MQQQKQWFMNRFLIYDLLAKSYRQGISREFIILFGDAVFMNEIAGQVDNVNWRAACLGLMEEVGCNEEKVDGYLADLKVEFARLFVGPEHLEAPPWESVYRTREQLLFGEPTLQVESMYRSFGLRCNTGEREPADHIGLEFSFMAELCTQGIEKLTQGKEAVNEIIGQYNFLAEHIMQWVPEFCGDLKRASQQKIYGHLALLTLGWIEADFHCLEKEIHQCNNKK